MTQVQMEALVFLAREQGINVRPFLIPLASLIPFQEVVHQIQRIVTVQTPPVDDLHRAIARFGKPDLAPLLLALTAHTDGFEGLPGLVVLNLDILVKNWR
jgi:predicted trehalose synthase